MHFIFAILLVCSYNSANAQNLFANPGFEEVNLCTEYRAYCAPEAWFNIPATNILVNRDILPDPFSGHMALAVPVGNVMANFNRPRYVYTGLCCPLVAHQKYSLSFYINTATVIFQQLVFYFTEKEPSLENVNQLLKVPVIISSKNIDTGNTNSWKHITYEYTAHGNEKFCIITTAGVPQIRYSMKDVMNKSGDVLYFIDDIVFKPDSVLPICPAYDVIKQMLYNQDYRHTNNILALPEVIDVPAAKPMVHFRNDTVTIAALLFDVGKYDLKPSVKNKLDSLIAVLSQKKFLKIEVSGHTDNSGNLQNNQILSENRAKAIQQYIITALPQFAEKIQSIGKGQNLPAAPNDTEAGRERNRRVEIVITYFDVVQ